MIAFVSGTIAMHTPQSLIVEVQGIGYEIFIPIRHFSLFPIGSDQKIFTYQKISEDTNALYGFASIEEKNLFITLISISGIGSKSALQMLEFPASTITNAIEMEDIGMLTKIPGLGKKTASRLILELKGKIVHAPTAAYKKESTTHQTAREMLKGLGFVAQRVDELFDTIPIDMKDKSDEDLVKWGLRALS